MNNLEAVQRFNAIQAERGETQQQVCKFLGIQASTLHRWKKNPEGKVSTKMQKRLLPESSQSKPLDVDSIEKKEEKQVIPLPDNPTKDSDSGDSLDKKGRSYNPAMHLDDENGNPLIENGNLVINPKQKSVDTVDDLKAEREKENEEKRFHEAERTEREKASELEREAEKSLTLKAESIATLSAFTFFKGGSAFFGKKFEPDNKEEKKEIEDALKVYWEAKGAPDIPPIVQLVTVLGMYTAKKVASGPAQPNTLFAKVKGWFANRKKKKFKAGLNKVQEEITNNMGEGNGRQDEESNQAGIFGGVQNGPVLN
jgi:hypothetical protein